jgi:uncharacterized membrane protein
MSALSEQEKRFVQGVGFLSGLTIVAYAYRVAISQSFRFGFVFENLALAWLGLIFGWLLVNGLKKRHWMSWQNIVLTILWLAFLPNTWYVLTDFLHISPTGEVSQLYDIVLMSLLVIGHPRAINITGLFFILLCSVYFALWLFLQPVNTRDKHN